MLFHVLSLFPDYFKGPFEVSMIKKAVEKELIKIECVNIRDFATNKHKTVDDRPFGGGPGMVLTPEPAINAVRSVKKKNSKVIYLSPQGSLLDAKKCEELAGCEHLIMLCGHYEGLDERIIESVVDEQISIGDYVLTSGCSAAVVLIDAVSRMIPGVLGHPESALRDSFSQKIFNGPQYTRPQDFEGKSVPGVLIQGNHAEIEAWREEQALAKTREVRSDLYEQYLKCCKNLPKKS